MDVLHFIVLLLGFCIVALLKWTVRLGAWYHGPSDDDDDEEEENMTNSSSGMFEMADTNERSIVSINHVKSSGDRTRTNCTNSPQVHAHICHPDSIFTSFQSRVQFDLSISPPAYYTIVSANATYGVTAEVDVVTHEDNALLPTSDSLPPIEALPSYEEAVCLLEISDSHVNPALNMHTALRNVYDMHIIALQLNLTSNSSFNGTRDGNETTIDVDTEIVGEVISIILGICFCIAMLVVTMKLIYNFLCKSSCCRRRKSTFTTPQWPQQSGNVTYSNYRGEYDGNYYGTRNASSATGNRLSLHSASLRVELEENGGTTSIININEGTDMHDNVLSNSSRVDFDSFSDLEDMSDLEILTEYRSRSTRSTENPVIEQQTEDTHSTNDSPITYFHYREHDDALPPAYADVVTSADAINGSQDNTVFPSTNYTHRDPLAGLPTYEEAVATNRSAVNDDDERL